MVPPAKTTPAKADFQAQCAAFAAQLRAAAQRLGASASAPAPNADESQSAADAPPAPSFDLILFSRTMVKRSMRALALLATPGCGHALVSHFMVGAERVGRCTPKNPRFLVAEGELAALLGPQFVVVWDSVGHTEDGRPLCEFLARRTGPRADRKRARGSTGWGCSDFFKK
jgi:hypothetical protein